jgi:hypothetical protein
MFSVPDPIPIGRPTKLSRLEDAQAEITALRLAVEDLERRLVKQAVLVRALWLLLGTKGGLTETQLIERFRQVEAEKAAAPPRKCELCGRSVNQRHNRCLYCDEPCGVRSAFELLELGAWPNPAQEAESASRPSSEGITRRTDIQGGR